VSRWTTQRGYDRGDAVVTPWQGLTQLDGSATPDELLKAIVSA
jgi:hypothetical protein